ncbi:MAG TPA: di-trans,poly-cis-decaprenylcistransferase [Alphaproteobacteria bacterium]|nr:di-trans,poly-cis-decaprenylcistransferase [Alphaproteobacteria bacterium]
MPNHLAIIMDGNSRWAKARNLPRVAGHKQGAENAKEITKCAVKLNIKYLTLYTFSSENWKRGEEEVSTLMGLLKLYLERDANELIGNGINLKFIGDLAGLPNDIEALCRKVEKASQKNDRLQLNIALNYGSKQEIVNAAKKLALTGREITEENLEKELYTYPCPVPDLMVRTGGDQRISNFLLWQSAYTELYFTETLWPDFNMEELQKAIEDFKGRERRFGGR